MTKSASRPPFTMSSNVIDMQDLKERTKKFALDIIRYLRKLPRGEEFSIIKYQLIKAATSTAANYRASQRAKSKS